MAELIFSIQNIFNRDNNLGCLHQYEAEKFHIPAYQRGYKWASKDDNDPVPILLNDLQNAFKKSPGKKYYLQYITISKRGAMLEVIDGQQRLTTLSIFLCLFHLILDDELNIAKDKLHYAIRPAVFEDHIYPKEKLQLLVQQAWNKDKGIMLDEKEVNNQDIFYIYGAARKIYDYINKLKADGLGQVDKFYQFILQNVMIIVNAVESHIPGEKVFRNLNSKKVPLTEVDLIKGLLLTKVARNQTENGKKNHFREILEIRSSLGRHWDEISSKANEPKFSSFFFGEGDGFLGLLHQVAFENGYKLTEKENDKHYPLFNFYNNQIEDVQHIFKELILYFEILNDWFQNNDTYNLLGYSFYTKENKSAFIKEHIKKSKSELITKLFEIRNTKLSENTGSLKYGDVGSGIHNVLLALNVFPVGAKNYRFDFYTFSKHKWTLEHIFPQSPEGKGRVLSDDQKGEVFKMLGGVKNLEESIKIILDKPERTDDEKDLYYEVLKSIGPLNDIGNMCFLPHEINASIGCGFFDEKRSDILKHIEQGKYVPVHSFEVFSKTILGDTPGDLLAWSVNDIENQNKVIVARIQKLKQETIA